MTPPPSPKKRRHYKDFKDFFLLVFEVWDLTGLVSLYEKTIMGPLERRPTCGWFLMDGKNMEKNHHINMSSIEELVFFSSPRWYSRTQIWSIFGKSLEIYRLHESFWVLGKSNSLQVADVPTYSPGFQNRRFQPVKWCSNTFLLGDFC